MVLTDKYSQVSVVNITVSFSHSFVLEASIDQLFNQSSTWSLNSLSVCLKPWYYEVAILLAFVPLIQDHIDNSYYVVSSYNVSDIMTEFRKESWRIKYHLMLLKKVCVCVWACVVCLWVFVHARYSVWVEVWGLLSRVNSFLFVLRQSFFFSLSLYHLLQSSRLGSFEAILLFLLPFLLIGVLKLQTYGNTYGFYVVFCVWIQILRHIQQVLSSTKPSPCLMRIIFIQYFHTTIILIITHYMGLGEEIKKFVI